MPFFAPALPLILVLLLLPVFLPLLLLLLVLVLLLSARGGRVILEGKKGVLWAEGRYVLLLPLLLLLLLLVPLLLRRVGVNCSSLSAASACPAPARLGIIGEGER